MHELASRALFEGAVTTLTDDLCAARGWTIHRREYPLLEVGFAEAGRTPVRVRFECRDWNAAPPSVAWLTADGTLLASLPQGPGGQLNNGAHPATGRPFVCMAGVREYHTHPGHVGDVWENYRGRSSYDLGGILTQVWRAWRATRP